MKNDPLRTPTILKEWLKNIAYKPNWEFNIKIPPQLSDGEKMFGDMIRLKLTQHVPDVNNSSKIIDLHFEKSIDLWMIDNKEAFYHFVEQAIHEFERHEFEEWFRIECLRKYNPHPEELSYDQD